MCSTDENSKLSVDLVKKEIYEEDKDFDDFDIDENEDDLPRVLDGPPKLIQCTSKVRLFDFLHDALYIPMILSQRCNPWEHYESECQHDQEECQSEYPHCNDGSGTENAYCQHFQVQEGGKEIYRCESCADKTTPADCIYDFGSKVHINFKILISLLINSQSNHPHKRVNGVVVSYHIMSSCMSDCFNMDIDKCHWNMDPEKTHCGCISGYEVPTASNSSLTGQGCVRALVTPVETVANPEEATSMSDCAEFQVIDGAEFQFYNVFWLYRDTPITKTWEECAQFCLENQPLCKWFMWNKPTDYEDPLRCRKVIQNYFSISINQYEYSH